MPAASGPIRVKVAAPVKVRAPRGDIGTSGASYGLPRAAKASGQAIRQAQGQQARKQLVAAFAKGAATQRQSKLKPVKSGQSLPGAVISAVESPAAIRVISGLASAGTSELARHVIPGVAKAQNFAYKIGSHGLHDIQDITTSAVPTTYHLITTALHDPGKAAGQLVAPYVHLYHHPLADLQQHPVGSLLLASGAEGALGHTLGRAARTGIAGKTIKAAADIRREPLTLPGTATTQPRVFSGDPLRKATTIVAGKVKAKVSGKPARATMTTRQVQRRADADVQTAKTLTSRATGQAETAATKAVGKRKPSPAVSLVAQGVTTADRASLERYLASIKAAQSGLTADKLAANLRTQGLLVDALKSHDPVKVQKAADAYVAFRGTQEPQVVAHGLVNAKAAQEARLAGPAVRLLNVSAQARKTAVKATRSQAAEAKTAAREATGAESQARVALERARGSARVSVATRKGSPVLADLERQRSLASRQLVQAKQAAGVATGRAQVLGRNVGGKAGGHGVSLAGEAVRVARGQVKTLDAQIAAEQARVRGVAPREADQLRNALAVRDRAAQTRQTANQAAKTAAREQRKTKQAPYANEQGRVSVADVKTAMGTSVEPAFVSQQPTRARVAALPITRKPSVPVKVGRSTSAITEGTLDIHPAKLVEQAADTARLLVAAKERAKAIEAMGYRPAPSEAVLDFKTKGGAETYAQQHDLQAATGSRWTAVPREDGRFSLVHADYVSRLAAHEKQAQTLPPLARAVFGQWRRNVLMTSIRWFVGNSGEAALRDIVHGAGPTSYVSMVRAMRAFKAAYPGEYEAMRARVLPRGAYEVTQTIARQRLVGEDVGRLAHLLHGFRQTRGPKQLGDLYSGYARAAFGLNALAEEQLQIPLGGRYLRDTLLADRLVKFSGKAARDAAEGLRNTDNQTAMLHYIQRAYGKYSGFGPGWITLTQTYTPFVAWSINALKFLYVVLPKDHPVISGLLASATQSEEQWRRHHGLEPGAPGALPNWLQGSIPTKGGPVRASRYTPFGIFESEGGGPLGGIPSLLLPQISEPLANLGGKDWKGGSLAGRGQTSSSGHNMVAAAFSLLEPLVPFLQQGLAVGGVRTPNMVAGAKIPPTVGERVNRAFNPFAPTNSATSPKVRPSGWGGGSSPGGSSGWGGTGKSSSNGWGG